MARSFSCHSFMYEIVFFKEYFHSCIYYLGWYKTGMQ